MDVSKSLSAVQSLPRRTSMKSTLLAALGWAGPLRAQTPPSFPVRPIRVVVPFPTGGGTDVVGRSLMQNMSGLLGQPIVIENKAGAGTVIGSDAVAKSAADGYTLLMTTSALAINASLVKIFPTTPYEICCLSGGSAMVRMSSSSVRKAPSLV